MQRKKDVEKKPWPKCSMGEGKCKRNSVMFRRIPDGELHTCHDQKHIAEWYSVARKKRRKLKK